MTDQPSRSDLQNVVAGLGRLEVRVDDAKAQSKRTADAASESERKSRNLSAIAIAVGLLGCLVGGFGWVVGDRAQTAIDTSNEVRATARVSSCDQAVDFASAHNELVLRNQELLSAIRGIVSDPDTQVFLDGQIAAYDANIVRVRDCSDEGITAFSEGTGGYLP